MLFTCNCNALSYCQPEKAEHATANPQDIADAVDRHLAQLRSLPGRGKGFTADTLAHRLARAGMTMLVDVRLNAVSRKKGFSKRSVEAAQSEAGIKYVHERDLGNPQDNRDSFRSGEGEEGREHMRAILNNGDGDGVALERLVALAKDSRIAVMCVERERERCHRDVITTMVQEHDPSIEILQVL